MYGGSDRVEHIASCQIDRRGAIEIQIDAGTVCSDDGVENVHDVPFGQVVGFESLGADPYASIDVQAGLGRHDFGVDDDRRADLSEVHTDQARHRDIRTAHHGLDPEASEVPKEAYADQSRQGAEDQQDDEQGGLGGELRACLLGKNPK